MNGDTMNGEIAGIANTGHASDREWQLYVSDRFNCAAETVEHIETCAGCQAGVAAYRLLFAGLKDQPRPVFDFDVTAMVLSRIAAETPAEAGAESGAQIPPTEAGVLLNEPVRAGVRAGTDARVERADRPFRYWTAAIILLVTGIPGWLFRKSLFYVFGDISSFFLVALLAATVFAVLLKIRGVYRIYQTRLRALGYGELQHYNVRAV